MVSCVKSIGAVSGLQTNRLGAFTFARVILLFCTSPATIKLSALGPVCPWGCCLRVRGPLFAGLLGPAHWLEGFSDWSPCQSPLGRRLTAFGTCWDSSLVGLELDSLEAMVEWTMKDKISAILDNPSHPLHEELWLMGSTFIGSSHLRARLSASGVLCPLLFNNNNREQRSCLHADPFHNNKSSFSCNGLKSNITNCTHLTCVYILYPSCPLWKYGKICAESRLYLFLRSASKHIVYFNKLTVPQETLVEELFWRKKRRAEKMESYCLSGRGVMERFYSTIYVITGKLGIGRLGSKSVDLDQ